MANESTPLGEELNQLSRLVFDLSATFWWLAVGAEFLAGGIGVFLSIVSLSNDNKFLMTVIGGALFVVAYALKLQAGIQYDRAETMRRQSVLTEGLDWPIDKVQFSEWRRLAGKRILKRFEAKPRDKNYYATSRPAGPERLLEMTQESAFYTRHMYGKFKAYVVWLIVVSVVGIVLLFTVPGFEQVPAGTKMSFVYLAYSVLPIILTADLIGLAVRLRGKVSGILEIERDIERLAGSSSISETQIMRLVSEYNCEVASGVPIHSLCFYFWRDDIQHLWKKQLALKVEK